MKERTKGILEASLRSFIKTGKPITSDFLYENYDFGIKPAMIRWELNDLGETGFMAQVHASGGRVPTNKAYRFFVDGLLEEEAEAARVVGVELENLIREFSRGKIRPFVERAAEYLQVASVGYEIRQGNIYESGLRLLLGQLETEEKKALLEVVEDMEFLGKRLKRIEIKSGGPQVFIGGGPLLKSDHVAIIIDEFDVGREPFLLLAVGPKRMDYRRSLRFFRVLEDSLEGN